MVVTKKINNYATRSIIGKHQNCMRRFVNVAMCCVQASVVTGVTLVLLVAAQISVACSNEISHCTFNHNMRPKSLTSQLHETSDTLHRRLNVPYTLTSGCMERMAVFKNPKNSYDRPPMTIANSKELQDSRPQCRLLDQFSDP